MASLSQASRLEDLPSSHDAFQGHATHIIEWSMMLRPKDSEGTCIPIRCYHIPPSCFTAQPTFRLLCPIRLSPRTSSFRETLPSHYFPTALGIPRGVSRVHRGGLKRDEVGGVLLCVPSALCGSPGLPEDTQVDLCPLLRCCVCPPHRALLPNETLSFRFSWLTSQGRYVRGSFTRRTRHASGDSPCHLSAKHHLLEASLLLMIPFRAMLLTSQSGLWSL